MKIPPKIVDNVIKCIGSDLFKEHAGDKATGVTEIAKACLALDDLDAIFEVVILLMGILSIKEFAIIHDSITSLEGMRCAAFNTKQYMEYNKDE